MISSRDYAAYLARHGSQEQRPRKPRGCGRVGVAKRRACELARGGGATVGDGWVELTVPVRTYNPTNGAQGRHWSIVAAKRKAIREIVAKCLVGSKPPLLPVVVTLTRLAPGILDDDNLRPAMKSVRDSLAVWLGCDDGDAEAVTWVYGPQVRQDEWGVKIRIETRKDAVT